MAALHSCFMQGGHLRNLFKEKLVRLYSLMGAAAVDDPEYGHIEPGEDGGFGFPDDLSDRLLRFHHRGKPAWETDEQRAGRMHGEEMARRRDPESLYTAVAGISDLTRQLAALQLGRAPAAEVPPEVSAELEALRKQVAELQASVPPAPAAEGTESAEKPARSRKPAAAKDTAAE
jgi:hypothetical protein